MKRILALGLLLPLAVACGTASGGTTATTSTTDTTAVAAPASTPSCDGSAAHPCMTDNGSDPSAIETTTEAATEPTTQATTESTTEAPATQELTTSQENAIEAAQSYLSQGQGFSRIGLIQQLSSKYGEGFSKKDAEFAVDYLHVNWRHQAVLSARSYLSQQSFSRSSLIQQLSSPYGEQFTLAQAEYAANKVGL